MKRTGAIFITGIMLLFLTACGTARWVRTPILEGSRTTVNLEHREEKKQIVPQQYDHPYQMPIENMAKLLGDLVYSERGVLMGRDKKLPVFQAVEIAILVPALTDSLAKATPDQRIQFISFNKGGGLLFKNTRKTEGILFVEPKGRINIAFNMINADAMDADSLDSPQIYTNSDPLKIKYADTTIIPAAPYGESGQLATGKPAPMWVVADAAKLAEAVASTPKPAPVVVTPLPVAAPTPAPVTAAPPPVVAPQPESSINPPTPPADQDDIKNKLKYLKGLYDDGLITEQEYAMEKKKLLDKIE